MAHDKARIYVSSTFSDLQAFRQEVSLALRRLGHEDVAMEYYGAGDERPLDRCLDDVASCDLYVGIFAWRYGYVPQQDNPHGRSITQLEYRQAQEKGIPCLIFMLSEEAPWPRTKQDRGAAAERIEALRQDLCTRHVVDFFQTADELTRKVNEAVIRWERESGLAGKRQLTDWDAYRQAVCDRHRWVRLQVIAGASKERGIARIPLTEVFEPQWVAWGVSGTDLPEEVRRYQEEIYGPRQQASDGAALTEGEEPEAGGEAIELEAEEALLAGNPEIVLDVLGREPAQVILGGPGSGKSTILHYAMLRVCQAGAARAALPAHLQSAPIPFLIELRNYVLQQAPDFVSYISRNARDLYDATVEVESLIELLEQEGQALVFFDGLDEVFDPHERRRAIDQFQTFAHRYPQARIVVTSRIAGYDRTALGLAGFEHYTLLPLTLGQIRHFAEQWYQYYALEGIERTAQGLVQRIIESPRLLDLAGNPLLLTMMAVIYKDRDLPNERWRLYERCAETLLEDWDLGKGIEEEDFRLTVLIRTAQKSEILQRVSMYMLEHGQTDTELNAIAYAPLLDIVASYLQDKYQRSRGDAEAVAVDILKHLMERTYVLAGIGERVFGFVHRTFMEYFAACRCQAQFNARRADFAWLTRDVYGAHWQGGEWEEVLLLLIAMLHDQGTPIREIVEYLRSECQTAPPHNLAFAARCLGEAGDVQDPAHGQALLADLAEAIAEHAPQSQRKGAREFVETALKAFAALAPLVATPAAVGRAIDRLNQEGSVPARMAAWQMGFALRARKERLDYALAALHDREEAVRRGAIAALEREWPGRADIGPVLAGVVRDDRHGRVRQAALAAMQRSWPHEPAILDAIAGRAEEETGYTNVVRLIEYMGATWRGNPEARDLVLRLAGPNPKARGDYDQASVVRAAAQALAEGWRSEALPVLLDWATNQDAAEARPGVLQTIAENWHDDPATLPWLQERAMQDEKAEVRWAAIEAIAQGWAGDPQALPWLRECATQDGEVGVRSAAIEAIAQGWAGDLQTLPWLRERATQDQDVEVRRAAIWAIGQGWAGDLQTLPWLRERATQDQDVEVRRAAIETIGQGWRGDTQTLAWLQERAAQDEDSEIRRAAIEAIVWERAGDPQTLLWLQERAAQDEDTGVRSVAIWAVGQRWAGDLQTLAWLLGRATQDEEAQVRQMAISAVGYVGSQGPQALAWLQERAAQDPDVEVRRAAIQAIGEGWRGEWLASLAWLRERASQDQDVEVRRAAIEMIGQGWGGDPQTLAWLQERATQDIEARQAAIEAIGQGWGGDPQTLAWLQERAAQGEDTSVRQAAIWAIGRGWGGDPQALAWLQERAAQEREAEVRGEAIWAVGQGWGGDPQILAWLQERAVQEQDSDVRQAALTATVWAAQGNLSIITWAVEQARRDPDDAVREEVREFLTQYQPWLDLPPDLPASLQEPAT